MGFLQNLPGIQALPSLMVSFVSAILLLAVHFTSPVSKFSFLHVQLEHGSAGWFGVFGYCYQKAGGGVIQDEGCSGTSVGYTIWEPLALGGNAAVSEHSQFNNSFLRGLSRGLIVNTFALVFTALVVLFSLLVFFSSSTRAPSARVLGIAQLIAAFFTFAALIVDLIFFCDVKRRVDSANLIGIDGRPSGSLESALWVILVAFLLQALFGIFSLIPHCYRQRRARVREARQTRLIEQGIAPTSTYGYSAPQQQKADDVELPTYSKF